MRTASDLMPGLSVRQIRICASLRRLVSEGAAELFREACMLLAEDPPRRTATHLIGHCLREVESALRAVLEPTMKIDGHDNSIIAVLGVLGIDPDSPVSEFWLDMAVSGGSRNLAVWAHRQGLDAPRRLDNEFRDLVRDFELMLDEVLERYRGRYVDVFSRLDDLLSVVSPGTANASALRQRFAANQITRHYFFSRAPSSWLPALRAAGFFTAPPEPVVNDDQSVMFPPWPEAEYLVRVVADDPAGVLEAALSVPATDNSRVTWNLVQIALALPAALAAQLAGRITAAVRGPYGLLIPQHVGALAVHLAAGGHTVEAMDLARVLLGDIPPRRGRATNLMSSYNYAAVLQDSLPTLAATVGRPVLTLLCDLLDKALEVDTRDTRSPQDRYDDSGIWRPAIETGPAYSQEDPRNGLTDAVRAAARQLVAAGEIAADDAVAEFASHRWTIFTRLALDILHDHGANSPNSVARYLCDAAVMSDNRVDREFLLLATAGHTWLKPRDRQKMIALIGQGPDANWYQRWRPDIGAGAMRVYAENWQRNRYAAVEDILSEAQRSHYLTLVTEHGPAPDPSQVPEPIFAVWRAGKSPLSLDQMTGMTSDALAEFLRTWQPPTTARWPEGEDRESLGVVLSESIEADAEHRSVQAVAFIGLPPDYVTSIVDALGRAAAQNRNLDWTGLLPLCTWIDDRARGELADGVTERSRRLWRDARVGVLRLVIHACNNNQCLGEGRADILWPLVLHGCADPDPDPSFDQVDDEEFNAVPLDGVRALGIHAAIAFGLCAARANAEADLAPVRQLLDGHLDIEIEPSLAVRATYGNAFEELLALDSGWATQQLGAIFSTTNGQDAYLWAAWNALLQRGRALSDSAWTLLRPQVERAINSFDSTTTDQWMIARAGHLGHQLMRRYWNGKLTLADPEQLLQRFYQNAPAEVTEALMRSLGISLANTGPLDAALSDRVKALWTIRVDAVDAGAAEPRELSEFDQWFVSGVFDEVWSLQQLLVALKRCRDMPLDVQTLRRLAELSGSYALPCLAILDQWLANEPLYWALSGHEDLMRSIIRAGRTSGEGEATLARKIVSVMLEQYGIDLRDALVPSLPSGAVDEV